jgi:hypothetical protein
MMRGMVATPPDQPPTIPYDRGPRIGDRVGIELVGRVVGLHVRDGVPGVLIVEPKLPEGALPGDGTAVLRSVWVPTDRVTIVARRQDIP